MSQHLAIAIAGRKHTGKSTFAMKMLLKLNQKVIIVDPNNSPAYKSIPWVTFKQLKTLQSGIVRYYNRDTDLMFDELWELFNPKGTAKKWNGTIMFDDATKYIDANPSKKVKSLLVDHRMYGINLLFTFHALSFVPQFFWKMLTHVVLFKTQDLMDENKREYGKRIPNFLEIYSNWKKVMNDNNEHAQIVVQTLI